MQLNRRQNTKVTEDSKLIIALGDSFVQGQGAYDEETWKSLDYSKERQEEELGYGNDRYFELMDKQFENSFVNVLAKDYLKDYTPINFGFAGNGNRAGTKALTVLHPDLELEKAKEKIVIFYVGQFCRFDFFNKYGIISHNYFASAWPHEPDEDQEPGIKDLWRGYATEVHTDKTEILEFICYAVEVQNWCKANNAKLIYVNSFEPRFDKKHITDVLYQTNDAGDNKVLRQLVDSIEWNKVMPIPGGHNNMVDLFMQKEDMLDKFNFDHSFYGWAIDYCKKHKSLTPEGYFTPCAHPSVKGQRLIAETIYNHIVSEK